MCSCLPVPVKGFDEWKKLRYEVRFWDELKEWSSHLLDIFFLSFIKSFRGGTWAQQNDMLLTEWFHSSVGKSTGPASQRAWVRIPLNAPEFFQMHIRDNYLNCPAIARNLFNRVSVQFMLSGTRLSPRNKYKTAICWSYRGVVHLKIVPCVLQTVCCRNVAWLRSITCSYPLRNHQWKPVRLIKTWKVDKAHELTDIALFLCQYVLSHHHVYVFAFVAVTS